jgi:hypothetical protein
MCRPPPQRPATSMMAEFQPTCNVITRIPTYLTSPRIASTMCLNR